MTDMRTDTVGDIGMSEDNMSTAITAAGHLPDNPPLGITTAGGTTHPSQSADMVGGGTMSAGMGEGRAAGTGEGRAAGMGEGRAAGMGEEGRDVGRVLTRVLRGDDLDDEI